MKYVLKDVHKEIRQVLPQLSLRGVALRRLHRMPKLCTEANLQVVRLSMFLKITTVKPRFNEPRYNEDPVITNNI